MTDFANQHQAEALPRAQGQTASFPESEGGPFREGVGNSCCQEGLSWGRTLPATSRPRPAAPLPADLVGTEALQGVVSKLVSHVHQVVVGVDVVQAVGLGLAGGFADVLAVPEETVEVELVGILAVRRQARVAGTKPQPRRSLAFPVPFPLMSCHLPVLGFCSPVPGGAIKRNGPWAALLLNRVIQSVETTDPSMHSCLLFGALKVHKGLQ